jgi:hypothetical protein
MLSVKRENAYTFLHSALKIIYLCSDLTIKPEESEIDAKYEDFDTVLQESDIICICCRGTSKNRDLFHKGAYLCKMIILVDALVSIHVICEKRKCIYIFA